MPEKQTTDDDDASTDVVKDHMFAVKRGEPPKHVGGGWYELSDGTRVQGQDAALESEAALF